MCGDLVFVGLFGVVYIFEVGLYFFGVVFGYDWFIGIFCYLGLLEYLVLWGIVVVVFDSECGLVLLVLNLVFDLGVVFDIVVGVCFGFGKISVYFVKFGLVGYGFGGLVVVFVVVGLIGMYVKFVVVIFLMVINLVVE